MKGKKERYEPKASEHLVALFYLCTIVLIELIGDKYLSQSQSNALDIYFNLVFYFIFAIILLTVCREKILHDLRSFRVYNYINLFIVTLISVVAMMVISAIVISFLGIGQSENQIAVDNAASGNKWLVFLTFVVLGPFVEEMVFRNGIYYFLRGQNASLPKSICSMLVTSVIFMLYHCRVSHILQLEYTQIVAVIPLFFFGMGLNFLQERTSNSIYPILLHMSINAIGTF